MNFEPVTSANFQEQVIKSSVPVLVEFGATWCQPCKRLEPELEKLKMVWTGRVRIGKVDVDVDPDLAMQFQIMGVPTVILYKNGQARQRITGFMPVQKLIDKFEPYL
jgi:thioredoxin 1